MKKFLHLLFNEHSSSEHARDILIINGCEIPVFLKKGRWLTNICVDADSDIKLKYKNENIQLLLTLEKNFIQIKLHLIKNTL
ncbi:TPA: hypothetical protein ACGGNX_004635 [Escherichia coli]